MRVGSLLMAVAALSLAVTGTAVAADNTPPLANAGVDQTVPVDSTVYLDGNASVDPDGVITSVSWSIGTPDGATTTPDCADCRRTEFDAATTGRYTVTLTVTDDDGATRSDTLYVTVTNESGPEVSVAGPDSTEPDGNATFTADVSADRGTLQTLTWLVNGSVVERDSLAGASANTSMTHSFDSTGTASVRAVVYDTLGDRGNATHQVSVASGGGGGDYECLTCPTGEGGADFRWTEDGETIVADTNGQDGLQTYRNGNLITIENPTQSSQISKNSDGNYVVAESLSDVDYNNVETSQAEVSIDTSSQTQGGPGGSPNSIEFAAELLSDTTGIDLDGANADTVESTTSVDVNDDGSVSAYGTTFGGVGDNDDSDDGSSDSGDDDSGGGGFEGGGTGLPF